MLRTSLYNYSNAYILVNGTITITAAGKNDAVRRLNERDKGVIFKRCAPLTDCISEINNTHKYNTKYVVVVMAMYNLIEISDNYSKNIRKFWQYYRDHLNNNITPCESFKYKIKIAGKTPADGNTKNVKIEVPLKYLSNFWRTLEMPLKLLWN